MKKPIFFAMAVFAGSVSVVSVAGNNMNHGSMGGMMQQMDANSDGMLSKEEFMRMHEQMFERMKGANSMVTIKDMPKNCMGMMEQGGMMGQDHQMPGMEKGTK